MARLLPTLFAPLLASLVGCMSSSAPPLRDATGWPIPTYALMEGVTCVNPVDGRVWSPRELRFRDRPARHEGLVCSRGGWQRRADAPYTPEVPPSAPSQPEPSRPPAVDAPGPALDTVR